MFVLTQDYYEDHHIKGVFTSVKKAQKYVKKVMGGKDLNWSEPNIKGSIWVDFQGSSLFIQPVEVNPES